MKIPKFKSKKKLSKKTNFLSLFKKFVFLAMVFSLIVGVLGVGYIVVVLKDAPTISIEDFESSNSTKIYDSEGVLVADVGYQIRENIRYEDLPQSVIDAFVAVEDSRFFDHNGFDLPRFTKAIFENILSFSFGQGGSTFTMQLVKSTYFETEEATAARSGLDGVNRKIKEIYTAIQAEQLLSKKRILELYLNRINFGVSGNKRGIQTAAQYYFGKDVQDINITEAAFLAGVINAPNAYNPLKNLDLAQERTNTVLYLMNYHGYISDTIYELALQTPLENLLVGINSTNTTSIPFQAYVDAVIDEVITLTGIDPVDVPMKIYTTMDRETQLTIEAIQNGEIENIAWPNEIIQTAIVTMNHQTGEVIAIGGGRFYNGERLYNRATDMTRQPGSSAKTVLTYPLAFENLGWSTSHLLEDKPIKYEGIDVIIKNFDNVYRGDILLPAAIGNSLNIPAIQTLTSVVDTIGTKKVVSYMNSIGFNDVTVNNFDIGYAIGGSTFEASPMQMAAAQSAILNGGNYITPHTITRIEFYSGDEPITPSYTSTTVLSDAASYMTAMMMEQNVSGPYSNFMQVLKRDFQVYAKTGTSDWGDTGIEYGIPEGAAKDKWMMAGTSEYTTAVWVGYDKAVKDQVSYLDRAQINLNLPGKINDAILDSLYKTKKATNIQRPSTVVNVTHVIGIYPYVAPNANTNPGLIVSGLIKSDYANLSTLATPNLANPSSFTANISATGTTKTLSFKLSDYPDANALTIAPSTKDYSLTVADQTVTATGQRLFDYSWIYGAVKYKLKITIDGSVVQELQSDSPSITTSLTIADTSTVVACGYYGYEFTSYNSTELCQTLKMSDLYLTIPDFAGKTLQEFQSFMSANGLTHSYTESFPSDNSASLSQIGKISTVTSNASSSSIEKAKLSQYNFVANIIDKNINLINDFVGKNADTRPFYCSLIPCNGPVAGTIDTVKYGSTQATNTNIKLSTIVSAGSITYTTTNTPPSVSSTTLTQNTGSLNASDVNGDNLSYSVKIQPINGQLSLGDNSYTYISNNPSSPQPDSFTITISDGLASIDVVYTKN